MKKGIPINIQAKVVGYEESIKSLRESLNKLDPGSSLAKNITSALVIAERQVNQLKRNLTTTVSSDAQLSGLISRVNNVGTALERIGEKFGDLSFKDLNIEELSQDIQGLIKNIDDLEKQSKTMMTDGLRGAIQDSSELSETFKKLNKDVEKLDSESGLNALQKGFEDATKKAEKFEKQAKAAADKAEEAYNQYNSYDSKYSRDNKSNRSDSDRAIGNLQKRVEASTFLEGDALKSLQDRIRNGAIAKSKNSEVADTLVNNLFSDLNQENLKEKLTTFLESYRSQAQGTISQFLGSLGLSNKNQLPELFEDPQKIQAKVTELKNILKDYRDAFKTSELISIEKDLNTQNIDDAFIKITNIIRARTDEINAEMQRFKNTFNQFSEEETFNKNQATSASQEAQHYSVQIENFRNMVRELEQKFEKQQNEIEDLKQLLNTQMTGVVSTIQEEAATSGQKAGEQKFPVSEAEQYSEQLSEIREKEQLLGQFEGAVKRWFSVLGAIRMVTAAFKSMKATIADLDATITEIAIVTDMSQKDLWGQMDHYVDMAQKYAVSIKGVYEVSQLYY